jgi:hypothetical protein
MDVLMASSGTDYPKGLSYGQIFQAGRTIASDSEDHDNDTDSKEILYALVGQRYIERL